MVRIPDLWGALSFTAEYDYLTARNIIYTVKDSNVRFKEDEVEGQAAYASLLGSWWIFSVLGEMKWYEGFDGAGFVGKTVSSSAGPEFKEEIQYGVLPPLEDEGLFIPPPYYDVFGGRVRVSGTIPRLGSTWWVTYARFQGLEEQTSPDDNTYVKHVYFGVEQRVDSLSIVGNLSGGQREEKVGLDHDYLMRHAAGDVQFPLFGPHSLALVGRVEMYDDSLSRPGEFTISRLSTTYSFAPLASLSGTWEHDGQPKSSTVAGDREDFFSGELTVRLKSDTFAKLFVGASRGGLRCAGGQCRTFPPFDGVRAELTVRF
jgi:hypothetical protein